MLLDSGKDRWLDEAVSGIRFGPDRRAVRAELEGHLEDKLADLRRIFPDITEEEAQDRALRSMGDAEELRLSLAKVHRPWLGYLWRASQGVLAAAVLLLLFSFNGWSNGWFESHDDRDWAGAGLLMPSGQRAEMGGYTVSMIRTGVWKGEEWVMWADLRVSAPWFWALAGQSLSSHTSAVDSLGNTYYSNDRWSRLDPPDYPDPMRWVRGGPLGKTSFHRDYWLAVWGVDPAAEWLRLDYEWLGSRFSMTVDFKEAGA